MRMIKRWKYTIVFVLIFTPLLALGVWWQVTLIKAVLG